jgi:hypothetical protein
MNKTWWTVPEGSTDGKEVEVVLKSEYDGAMRALNRALDVITDAYANSSYGDIAVAEIQRLLEPKK